MVRLSSEIGYYCLGDSKVRSVGMGIPYTHNGAVHLTVDFESGVCDGPRLSGLSSLNRSET
jgi:hypothetical protein